VRTLHVGLRVTDMERSIAFYRSVGYEVLGQVRPAESMTLTMLKLPDDEFVSLELVHDRGHPRVDSTGLSHLVINVHALDQTLTDLTSRGVEAEGPTSPDGSHELWTAWVTDPDGFRIELVQWPPGHPAGMTRTDLEPPAPADD
jgi:lactoylglutathione lyase